MKKALHLLLLLSFFTSINAQKKKEIRKHHVKTLTIMTSEHGKTMKDSRLTFNPDGSTLEEIKYTAEGIVKSITKFKYNSEGDVTEELEYDGKNNLLEKRLTKYNLLGEKSEELTTDKNGKQIKKVLFVYDHKGLRIEKKTFDANNILQTVKKNLYTYK